MVIFKPKMFTRFWGGYLALIIRTVFNNQEWAKKCINADGKDKRLLKCWKKTYKIGYEVDKNGNCLGDCWESNLCNGGFWRNATGNFKQAKENDKVYFFYQNIDNSLTLLGISRIERVVEDKIYFKKFRPLPIEKRFKRRSEDIIGKFWGSNTFRYINDEIENRILNLMEVESDSFIDSVEPLITDKEGKKILRKHMASERSVKLVNKFKESLKSYKCQICNFDFEETYGSLGRGFIEAHHIKPVSSLQEDEVVSTRDLVAVCSNCHRMLHREIPPIDMEKLKTILNNN